MNKGHSMRSSTVKLRSRPGLVQVKLEKSSIQQSNILMSVEGHGRGMYSADDEASSNLHAHFAALRSRFVASQSQ